MALEIAALFAALAALTYLAALMSRAAQARAAGLPLAPGLLVEPARLCARLLVKARRTTPMPDAVLWRLGPIVVLAVPILAATVVPFAPGMAVADPGIGIVWWTAMMALLWVGIFMTGFGANAAFPLVAGYRYAALALAYEMPLAIVVITVGVAAESLQVSQIVARQEDLWFVAIAPAGFAIYVLAACAMAFYGPFAVPVASDLAGGVRAELGGVERLFLVAGQYLVLVVAAAFAVPLFLGGHHGPFLPDWLWLVLKTVAMLALLVSLRHLLPRIRIDRFEEFAWIVLIPLSLAQLFVVCAIVLFVW